MINQIESARARTPDCHNHERKLLRIKLVHTSLLRRVYARWMWRDSIGVSSLELDKKKNSSPPPAVMSGERSGAGWLAGSSSRASGFQTRKRMGDQGEVPANATIAGRPYSGYAALVKIK